MEKQLAFTKYEIARIIGARALQLAMDAPLLLKISEAELKAIKYDSIRIAEKELEENVLPIDISRPTPQKKKEKLATIKEEHVSDEELIEKEKEVEKEIASDAEQLGLIAGDEVEDYADVDTSSTGKEEQ
jgi:DNA-directed RNA polymerase subunit K